MKKENFEMIIAALFCAGVLAISAGAGALVGGLVWGWDSTVLFPSRMGRPAYLVSLPMFSAMVGAQIATAVGIFLSSGLAFARRDVPSTKEQKGTA